jgi:hypothetical protein
MSQFESEVQHLLKVGSKGKLRDQASMAASLSAKELWREDCLDQGVELHFESAMHKMSKFRMKQLWQSNKLLG